MFLSVVVPTYNEKENAPEIIRKLDGIMKEKRWEGEIVIVDDNSPDGTASEVRKLMTELPNIQLYSRPGKLGLGSAYQFGARKARGEIVVTMDADFSHDPSEFPKLVMKVQEGYDLALGSRHMKGSFYEHWRWRTSLKYSASKLGNLLIAFMLHAQIHDFTTGYKAVRRQAVRSIEVKSVANSALIEFNVKILRRGYRVSEIPVRFYDRRKGEAKTKLGRESIKALVDVFRIVILNR